MADRREAILKAAASEFGAVGFSGGRVERIARGAGVSKQLVFHYFKTKEQLYSTVVYAALSECSATVLKRTTPVETVKCCVTSVLSTLAGSAVLRSVLADRLHGQLEPAGVSSSVDDWLQSIRSAIADAIETGQRQGFFRDDVPSLAASDLALSSIVGWALVSPELTATSEAGQAQVSDFQAFLGQSVVDFCVWR